MSIAQEIVDFFCKWEKHEDLWLDVASRLMFISSATGISLLFYAGLFVQPFWFVVGVWLCAIPTVWRSFLGYLTWRPS